MISTEIDFLVYMQQKKTLLRKKKGERTFHILGKMHTSDPGSFKDSQQTQNRCFTKGVSYSNCQNTKQRFKKKTEKSFILHTRRLTQTFQQHFYKSRKVKMIYSKFWKNNINQKYYTHTNLQRPPGLSYKTLPQN